MRLIIVAAGQIKSTPEATLFDTYHDWIERRGRPIGITQLEVQELRSKKSSARAQQDRLDLSQAMDRILTEDPTTYFVLLDERGRQMTSAAFAHQLQEWCDADIKTLCFVLAGADGFDDVLRGRAQYLLSLSQMSWPHLMARALLAEQIWRAISILTNHPYHRA